MWSLYRWSPELRLRGSPKFLGSHGLFAKTECFFQPKFGIVKMQRRKITKIEPSGRDIFQRSCELGVEQVQMIVFSSLILSELLTTFMKYTAQKIEIDHWHTELYGYIMKNV